MNLDQWIETIEARCTKSLFQCNGPEKWFVELHHISGVVCRGEQTTLLYAIEAAAAHGRERAKSMGKRNWEF